MQQKARIKNNLIQIINIKLSTVEITGLFSFV